VRLRRATARAAGGKPLEAYDAWTIDLDDSSGSLRVEHKEILCFSPPFHCHFRQGRSIDPGVGRRSVRNAMECANAFRTPASGLFAGAWREEGEITNA